MDDFLDIASSFDWITPTWAYFQDILNGPSADFGINAYAGWGRRDIKRVLNERGIKVWGLMLNLKGDMLMFTVKKSQARYAGDVLRREGVPLMYVPKECEEE